MQFDVIVLFDEHDDETDALASQLVARAAGDCLRAGAHPADLSEGARIGEELRTFLSLSHFVVLISNAHLSSIASSANCSSESLLHRVIL